MSAKWSYSGLKQYINCPKSYYEIKVAKNFAKIDNQYTMYGKAVHRAIENFILANEPFPVNYRQILSQVPEIVASMPKEKYVEHHLAVTEERQPCDFESDDFWVRGIVDFMAIDNNHAAIIDWKTGNSKYADIKQLKLMAVLTFANFPKVKEIHGMLYFTKNKQMMFSEDYKRKDIDLYWASFAADLAMLELSFKLDSWPAKQSGLCGFCPVVNCIHHKE